MRNLRYKILKGQQVIGDSADKEMAQIVVDALKFVEPESSDLFTFVDTKMKLSLNDSSGHVG